MIQKIYLHLSICHLSQIRSSPLKANHPPTKLPVESNQAPKRNHRWQPLPQRAAEATEIRNINSKDIGIAGLLKNINGCVGVMMELCCLMMEWLFDDGYWLFQVVECVGYGTCFDFSVWQKTVLQNAQKKTGKNSFENLWVLWYTP